MEREFDGLTTICSDEWARVNAIVHEAIALPPAQRDVFLEHACEGNTVLLQLVRSLMISDAATLGGIESVRPSEITTGPIPSSDPRRDLLKTVEISLPRGLTSAQTLEIQVLLRHRLQIVTLIGLFGALLFNLVRLVQVDSTHVDVWRTVVPGWAYVAGLMVIVVLLNRRQPHTLPQLRWFEALVFGLSTVYFVGETYKPLFIGAAWLIEYSHRPPAEMSILARQPGVFWMTVIIIYGTFIPSTGRRCAAVTLTMSLAPLVTITVAGLKEPSISSWALFLFVTELTLWLAVAVAIAIYGSHKITVLREEALAARRLGQYQLRQRLAQGSMGDVYLAEHLLLKRPCAVKVIRPERAGDARTLERFLREVQITATLTHPNTIQVFDYGRAGDGTAYYAMEYLPGLNLEEMVARHGPLSPPRVVFLLRQLCGALAEAHAVGLIHRDIKPGNVIVCARGGQHDVAKLLDFGLVRLAAPDASGAALSQAGLILGTPAYMAPEQASGTRPLDARSDIYSLGALAYFLLTGQPPFVRASIVETLAAHMTEPAIPVRHVNPASPADLDEVVMRSLAKDPERRFPDVASLERALELCGSSGEWTEADAVAWWSVAVNVPSSA